VTPGNVLISFMNPKCGKKKADRIFRD